MNELAKIKPLSKDWAIGALYGAAGLFLTRAFDFFTFNHLLEGIVMGLLCAICYIGASKYLLERVK